MFDYKLNFFDPLKAKLQKAKANTSEEAVSVLIMDFSVELIELYLDVQLHPFRYKQVLLVDGSVELPRTLFGFRSELGGDRVVELPVSHLQLIDLGVIALRSAAPRLILSAVNKFELVAICEPHVQVVYQTQEHCNPLLLD